MAASLNIPVYSDALVVLGTAGIVVPMVHRWGLSPVIASIHEQRDEFRQLLQQAAKEARTTGSHSLRAKRQAPTL